VSRAPGHCNDDAAWADFSSRPEYASKSRERLAMGGMTDFELANAQFMVDRRDTMLGAYQTAAKDRIRWLSVQLAKANSELANARLKRAGAIGLLCEVSTQVREDDRESIEQAAREWCEDTGWVMKRVLDRVEVSPP
jgi:hypothetical protein